MIKNICFFLNNQCNLHCKYCFIKENVQDINFNNMVYSSWESGQYLFTIKQVLEKLNADFKNIENIFLYGGEPLLNLKYFNEKIPKLFELFPNISHFFVSTNFNINIKDVVTMFKKIDLNANQQITFNIQISYDGAYENGHNLSLSVYKEKFKTFFEELNKYKFKNLIIKIKFRTTFLEDDFIHYFINEENILNYINSFKELFQYIDVLNTNNVISSYSHNIIPNLAVPSHMTSQDGIELLKIFKMWYKIIQDDDYLFYEKRFIDLFSSNHECYNFVETLIILPDGTITHCLQKNTLDILYKKEKNIYVFNPLTMEDNQINSIIENLKHNISTSRSISFNLCKDLLKAKQISEIYNDDEILLKHIVFLENIINCMFEALTETQIPFANSPSFFRKYFNGVVEYLYNQNNLKAKKETNI